MADALIKHAFFSPYLDGLDPTKLQPSEWNKALLVSGGVAGQVLARDAVSPTGASWLTLPTPDLSALVLTTDPRLSDARVPLVHTHLFADLTISKSDLGLGLVENTALSTWGGSANLTTIGPITAAPGAVLVVADTITFKPTGTPGNGVVIIPPHANTDNTFFGMFAGNGAALGFDNSAFGMGALQSLTTGNYNTAVGQSACDALTTALNNTAVGVAALFRVTTGSSNTALGFHALDAVVTGNNNVAVGSTALQRTTASDNVAVGLAAGTLVVGGAKNSYVGYQAGASNVSGSNNVALGYWAGLSALGSGNVCLGYSAGAYETGSNRLFIDNAPRASEADARLKALIYGVFDAAIANQTLALNATVSVSGGLVAQGLTALMAGLSVGLGGGYLTPGVLNGGASFAAYAPFVHIRGTSRAYLALSATAGLAQFVMEASTSTVGKRLFSTTVTADVAQLQFCNEATFAVVATPLELSTAGVKLGGYLEGTEQTAPAAPAANKGRVFLQDNGSGKTQLMVIFATGAAQQIAIEP